MVLARYLIKRYVAYFCALTVFLSLLFNLIEFFEKLMRASQVSFVSVGYFVFLNCTASFLDLMPLGAWLATCLVIRDLIIQEEWEILTLLGVQRIKALAMITSAACLVMITGVVLDEIALRDLANKAEQYRQETFKGRRMDRVIDGWYKLSERLFCRVGLIDFKTNTGSQLFFFYLSDAFSIKKIIEVPVFSFKDKSTDIIVIKGKMLNFQADGVVESILDNSSLYMPVFLEKIADNRGGFSLVLFFKRYVLSKLLVSNLGFEWWGLLIERLFFYIQLILLSIMTLLVFFIFEQKLYGRWVGMLLVYPLHMVIGAAFCTVFGLFFGILLFILFYLFLIVTLFSLLYRSKEGFW